MTTASAANALRAHEVGAPDCPGELELAVDFRQVQLVAVKPRGRRRSSVRVPIDSPATSPVTPQPPAA